MAQVDFAVSDKAPFGLFLRTRPDSSTSSTKKALLPMGQRVNKLNDSEVPDWWEVSTALAGEALQGFVKSTFLTPLESFEPPAAHQSLSPVHLRTQSPVTRNGTNRAFPLNESGKPTRNATATAAVKAAQLGEIIEWLRTETSPRYKAITGGATFCNIYAYDYCFLAGAYLPRVWWTPDAIQKLQAGHPVSPLYDVTVQEINANSLFNWLGTFGPTFGWTRIFELTRLQSAANDGQVCLICAQQKNTNRPGHICAVVPETDTQKAARNGLTVTRPLQSQAGRTNHSYKAAPVWWTREEFRDFGFWVHA